MWLGTRRWGLLGALLISGLALALPGAAFAHGLIKRAALPIPEGMFIVSAVVVLVVSFAALAVLWQKPKLEDSEWRPVPGGRAIASRPVEIVCGLIGVALLGVVLAAGYVGAQAVQTNFTPTFVFIIFWVGLVFVSALFGDVFKAFNPWRAIGRVIEAVTRRQTFAPYPEQLGRWPAAAGLLAFTWVELVSGWAGEPLPIAILVTIYTVYTLAAQFVWGTETWTRYGESFSVYFNLFARLSIFETRDRVLGIRPFLAGLTSLERVAGTVGVIVVLIGTVTYDGLSAGALWRENLGVWINDGFTGAGFGIETAAKLTGTVGLLLGVAIIGAFYNLGIRGTRTVGGDFSQDGLRFKFAHSLVPIAMVYAMAHYLTYLVFDGQAIGFLASDPLGEGWNLFGTAKSTIDFSVLSQNAIWYLQVGFVVGGHVAALVLAHDRALVLYGDSKQATRSQYWMLAVMVGFTFLALWLLWKANA